MENHQIMLIGTANTGKTSYLAALYHLVSSDFDGKKWQESRLSPDTEYINAIHNQWLRCQVQGRTEQRSADGHKVTIYLEDVVTREEVTIRIPDIAGEEFKQQWLTRTWNKEYDEAVKSATGILFFLHSDKIVMPILVEDVSEEMASFLGEDDSLDDEESKKDETIYVYEEWQPNSTPTQVIAVDLLQFHMYSWREDRKVPIAVVISAWDLVESSDKDLTPMQWITENLPLLHQFLIANSENITFNVYGVSAQGGSVESIESQNILSQYDEPAERIKIKEDQSIHSDICVPIEWLINSWKATQK